MNPRLFLCTLLLALSVSPALAQEAEAEQETIKIGGLAGVGTKLIYEVDANGQEYDFIVTMKDKTGKTFDWEMTAPVSIKGSITHADLALEEGNVLYNYFTPGAKALDIRTTSVWLSRILFSKWSKTAAKPLNVYAYGPDEDPVWMGTFTGTIPMEITLDGKKVLIGTELVKKLVKTETDGYVPTGDDSITFLADAQLPIIVSMQLGFSIRLKEVRTR